MHTKHVESHFHVALLPEPSHLFHSSSVFLQCSCCCTRPSIWEETDWIVSHLCCGFWKSDLEESHHCLAVGERSQRRTEQQRCTSTLGNQCALRKHSCVCIVVCTLFHTFRKDRIFRVRSTDSIPQTGRTRTRRLRDTVEYAMHRNRHGSNTQSS